MQASLENYPYVQLIITRIFPPTIQVLISNQHFYFNSIPKHLSGVRPDVLEDTVLLGQSVERVISLGSRSDVTGQSVGDVVTGNGSASLVDLGDVDLDGGVVISLDDSVSGRALSGNVKLDLG